jgi:hypothetical protein
MGRRKSSPLDEIRHKSLFEFTLFVHGSVRN